MNNNRLPTCFLV